RHAPGAARGMGRRVRPVAGRVRAGRVRIHAGQPADAGGRRAAHQRRPGRPGDRHFRCLCAGHQFADPGAGRTARPQGAAAGADGPH
nr:hypothetical protein [Tanacetum cinerariifolium]